MHSSLKTKTNMRLLILWAVALVAVTALMAPPWVSMVVGAVLGTVSASLQLRALHKTADRLILTTSLLEVRQALASSPWGQWYLRAFWVSQATILAVSIVWYRSEFITGMVAGYLAYAICRELLTLRGTRFLERLAIVE
jgi:hypothetical protein